jgi:hypothetical protein
LYSSPNIIRMIKSRRMRWAGYVARWWKWEWDGIYLILSGMDCRKPRETLFLRDRPYVCIVQNLCWNLCSSSFYSLYYSLLHLLKLDPIGTGRVIISFVSVLLLRVSWYNNSRPLETRSI